MSELETVYAKIESDAAEKQAEKAEREKAEKQGQTNMGYGCLAVLGAVVVMVLITQILGEQQKVDEHNANVSYRKGNMCLDREDYKQAVVEFTNAIEHNPNHYKAYYNRSMAYSELGQRALAIRDIKTYMRISGRTDALGHPGQGVLHRRGYK